MPHAFRTALTLGLLLVVFGAVPAPAADEPSNLIKYRKATMTATGGHMGARGAMAEGDVSFTYKASFRRALSTR